MSGMLSLQSIGAPRPFIQCWKAEWWVKVMVGNCVVNGQLCGECCCSVSWQRADCCWARTSQLTKLSVCRKQPILGTGSVNTVRIDWMGSHGKSRAHLDCFREGMGSECCRHHGKEHPECPASCVKYIFASSFCQIFFFKGLRGVKEKCIWDARTQRHVKFHLWRWIGNRCFT